MWLHDNFSFIEDTDVNFIPSSLPLLLLVLLPVYPLQGKKNVQCFLCSLLKEIKLGLKVNSFISRINYK